MRHDWIFDVLTDLHAYACRNDLPGLARKVEAALDEARQEIAANRDVSGLAAVRGRRERPN